MLWNESLRRFRTFCSRVVQVVVAASIQVCCITCHRRGQVITRMLYPACDSIRYESCIPVSSMGSHISAVPNHQVNRITSLEIRGHVAMSGNFGYELDLTKFTEEENDIVKAQVELYKEIRGTVNMKHPSFAQSI